ncbi:integration host factor subunit alpha [Tistrella mobilis]
MKLRAQVFEDKTMARTVTRADLAEAVYQEVGLSRHESAQLVEAVLSVVSDSLVEGDTVKISSFGTFAVRQKGERVGRNPKTGEEVPILPRKVLVFRASNVLKDRIGKSLADIADLDLETEDDEAEA